MSQGWALEAITTDSTYSFPLQQGPKVLQDREEQNITMSGSLTTSFPKPTNTEGPEQAVIAS